MSNSTSRRVRYKIYYVFIYNMHTLIEIPKFNKTSSLQDELSLLSCMLVRGFSQKDEEGYADN